MATVKKGRLVVSLWMSDTNPKTHTNKVSTLSFNPTTAGVTAYNAAADDAARAATLIGELLVTIDDLTKGIDKQVDVGFTYESNLAPPTPDTFALNKDKFLVSSRDVINSEAQKVSIPARNDAAIVIESDGITVDITAPDMSTFVSAYEAVCLSDDGNALEVLRAVISK